MQKLIIVSNRLPIKIDRKGNSYEVKQSDGGLVSALKSLAHEKKTVTWVGIADFKREVWDNLKDSVSSSNLTLKPIFVDKKNYALYYNGFSNALIWPLFHYFPSFAEYDPKSFDAYKHINQQFADKIKQIAGFGDTIWVHDYHLMLLPKYIREIRPDLNIGFFLHIPFPSYEIFKLLPSDWRTELLEGLIQADLVGFHTSEYVKHFKNCLGYFAGITTENGISLTNTNSTLIKPYPISIDFQKFNQAFDHPVITKRRKTIRQQSKNVKIIFSVDRLDYTKGVINRLQAYESLLESHPEYREKTVFVINVVPSRDQIPKYAERKRMIEENIGRINGLYGTFHWHPIVYQYRHLTFNQLMSFYSAADIVLVTPLRDGMNLVAKEFVASRKDKKGVLILSEFAGAASELSEAIIVNPNDAQNMKSGLIEALSLKERDQIQRMGQMQNTVKTNDIHKWASSFLEDLKKAKHYELLHKTTFNDF